ncbi:hypothetical protein ACFQU7_14235 [Pseudoroseomonas wenyumeiae]
MIRRIWTLLPRRLRREALFGAMAALAPRIDRPEPDGQGCWRWLAISPPPPASAPPPAAWPPGCARPGWRRMRPT